MADDTLSPEGTIEKLESRPLNDEDCYFLEQAYKSVVEGIGRIEETAKFLVGGTVTASGLYVAAFKLYLADSTVSEPLWFLPFLLWGASIIAQILVLYPMRYRTVENAPASWKRAFLKCRGRKYFFLTLGAALFVAGLLAGAFPFFTDDQDMDAVWVVLRHAVTRFIL